MHFPQNKMNLFVLSGHGSESFAAFLNGVNSQRWVLCNIKTTRQLSLYTRYPIVARSAWHAAWLLGRVLRASKGILYARYLCSRDALGLKAGRPSAARDDRVSCIQKGILHTTVITVGVITTHHESDLRF